MFNIFKLDQAQTVRDNFIEAQSQEELMSLQVTRGRGIISALRQYELVTATSAQQPVGIIATTTATIRCIENA